MGEAYLTTCSFLGQPKVKAEKKKKKRSQLPLSLQITRGGDSCYDSTNYESAPEISWEWKPIK